MSTMPVIINVDDHEPARYAKARVLSRAGFTVYDAATGTDALSLVATHNPDLVLLDVNLPDVNGIEVCRRVKSRPGGAFVIVLQISASATAAPRATAALDSGADAYLAEPVDPDVLVSTIKALLRLQRAERELSAANERLQLVNQELSRSNEDLQQFAFAASHDLQEPLRTISSFATLLERRASSRLTQDETEFLKHIVQGAQRMRALIGDLLAYSQVGQEPQSWQLLDLKTVLPVVLENLSESIAQSGAEISFDQLPSVCGDDGQLGQVFQNLLSNAIKYSRSGLNPVIHISADRDQQQWLIRVADNGIGIPEHQWQTIFRAFKRLHGKEVPGTGIGLAVCRKIIEAHGGRIWVSSVAGQGSTFSFTLPAAST